MGIIERRQGEREALRKKIINAANKILINEGFESLSIRRIAKEIDYSTGTIYHYFKDKSDIVTAAMEEGYLQILETIALIPVDYEKPEKTIMEVIRAYIDLMLETPEQFKAILMNDIGAVQDRVNILSDGISKERKSIQSLCMVIELGIKSGCFRNIDVESTAQIIWTSTYGLLSRLILEKNIPREQKDKLINNLFDILFNGIIK